MYGAFIILWLFKAKQKPINVTYNYFYNCHINDELVSFVGGCANRHIWTLKKTETSVTTPNALLSHPAKLRILYKTRYDTRSFSIHCSHVLILRPLGMRQSYQFLFACYVNPLVVFSADHPQNTILHNLFCKPTLATNIRVFFSTRQIQQMKRLELLE